MYFCVLILILEDFHDGDDVVTSRYFLIIKIILSFC